MSVSYTSLSTVREGDLHKALKILFCKVPATLLLFCLFLKMLTLMLVIFLYKWTINLSLLSKMTFGGFIKATSTEQDTQFIVCICIEVTTSV